MKHFAALFLLLAGSAFAQTVIEVPAAGPLTEDMARSRCIVAINLAGKRPADASMPKTPGRTIDKDYLFRWKTASGFMNCEISTEKRGKMKIFASAQ